MLAVKQLDTSMRNLTQWLSAVENELSGGISFKDTGLMEIQEKLQDSQVCVVIPDLFLQLIHILLSNI